VKADYVADYVKGREPRHRRRLRRALV